METRRLIMDMACPFGRWAKGDVVTLEDGVLKRDYIQLTERFLLDSGMAHCETDPGVEDLLRDAFKGSGLNFNGFACDPSEEGCDSCS